MEDKKMKIAFFVDNFYPTVDGVTKVVEMYSRILHSKGHEIELFVPDKKGYHIELPFNLHECAVTGRKHFGYFVPKKDREFAAAAEKYVKESRPDIIHVHSPFVIGRLGARLAKKYGIPCVMTFHSQYKRDLLRYSKSRLITYFLMMYVRQIYKNVDLAFTMNNACLRTLREYGYRGECVIINNGTELSCPGGKGSLDALCDEKYGTRGRENVMLFAGRIIRQKNVFFIVEVLDILNRRGLDFTFIFVGEGADRKQCEAMAQKSCISDKLIFTGQIYDRRELASCFSRAELLLFPSLYDASSLIQIEAAAFYTPAVFVNGAVTADTITPEVNGYIAPNDPEKYADKVMSILADKESLKKTAENAHAQIYKTWGAIVDEAEKQYRTLIN